MAAQLGAVLAAFRAADVPDDIAQRAAAEPAGYENRFRSLEDKMAAGFADVDRQIAALERRISTFEAKTEARFAKIEGDINLLRWMVTFNLGLTLLVLGKLFGVIHN